MGLLFLDKTLYQHLYQRFLQANPGTQHFAAHSHHYWPDVTRQAMLEYWDDSARFVDKKWDYIFEHKIAKTSQLISQILNTQKPEQLVFAPNTHELVFRILSCLDLAQPIRILTTDSEFHSFERQIKRMQELSNVHIVRIATEPAVSFQQRFISELQQGDFELVYLSQVFFNSALAVEDLNKIVASAPCKALFVIDGYHGFMAMPTDLSAMQDRVFYLAGGYKYAQGGEGCCFAHIPSNNRLRPLYTGWFAEFGELANSKSGQISYSKNGMQFAGSTMDFSAVYRLCATLELYRKEGIDVPTVHAYVQKLQSAFLVQLEEYKHPTINKSSLIAHDLNHHGHFLTFKLPSPQATMSVYQQLQEFGVQTDCRGDRLRFGFGLYQCAEQFDLSCIRKLDG